MQGFVLFFLAGMSFILNLTALPFSSVSARFFDTWLCNLPGLHGSAYSEELREVMPLISAGLYFYLDK